MNGASRYHDFSAGHRVAKHENKCAALHGHNYRVVVDVVPARARGLDTIGRVMDFGVIKGVGEWLESNWDHKFLYWEEDRLVLNLHQAMRDEVAAGDARHPDYEDRYIPSRGFVQLPFNPTAENMAAHIGRVVCPQVLGPDVTVCKITVWETRKCFGWWEPDR